MLLQLIYTGLTPHFSIAVAIIKNSLGTCMIFFAILPQGAKQLRIINANTEEVINIKPFRSRNSVLIFKIFKFYMLYMIIL